MTPPEEIFDLTIEPFKRFRVRTSPSDPGRVYRVEMITWEDDDLVDGPKQLAIYFKPVRTVLTQGSLRRRIAAPENVIDAPFSIPPDTT